MSTNLQGIISDLIRVLPSQFSHSISPDITQSSEEEGGSLKESPLTSLLKRRIASSPEGEYR